MLYVTFLTVGDLPKGAFQDIRDDFLKRLGPYVKLDHRIVENVQKIGAQIPSGDYVIVLDERGKQLTSTSAAQTLKRLEDEGRHIAVVLGGPKGLSNEIKQRADLLLALSSLTFTHDLAHLIFLEQLYRAMTIIRGKEYHY